MKKKFMIVFIPTLLFYFFVQAQINRRNNIDVSGIYENTAKYLSAQNYMGALENLNREAGINLYYSDSLVYLKIKILENLYPTSARYADDLDATLKVFARNVGYSFPELKKEEVKQINITFLSFKEKDEKFYQSVLNEKYLFKVQDLKNLNDRILEYLRTTPNSHYKKELTDISSNITLQRNNIIRDSTNHAILHKIGKKRVLSISYSVPSGTIKNVFTGLKDYNDVVGFFNGTSAVGLGAKYTVGASIGNVLINLYTGKRFKVAIDWSIFDGEYTSFDWSSDTLLKDMSATGNTMTELKSVKAGTRIGPLVSAVLSKTFAVSIYYSFRPGVQFLLENSYFGSKSAGSSTVQQYSIKPDYNNYNMSGEIGLKFYLFSKLYINPFIHTGNYKWKNTITTSASGSGTPCQTNYHFSFYGVRLGI
jgi:hypothetical protein